MSQQEDLKSMSPKGPVIIYGRGGGGVKSGVGASKDFLGLKSGRWKEIEKHRVGIKNSS